MAPKLRRDVIGEIEMLLLKTQPATAGRFFASAPVGTCVRNGFIQIQNGRARLTPHRPDQRTRWMLDAEFDPKRVAPPPEGSMLDRLIGGAFWGDPDSGDKYLLVAEMFGAAISGQATKLPSAVAFFLIGETADNGKSTILDCLRAILPPEAVVSVPLKKLRDERHLIRLLGKTANVVDEADAEAIDASEFKRAITGQPLVGRDVYASAFEFVPQALHAFSCNALPNFSGGFDRGVRRRVLPITFNRTIPSTEKIPDLAARIVADEADALVGFAVWGALRLAKAGRYTVPASSAAKVAEWGRSDPVTEWAEGHVRSCKEKPLQGWPRRPDCYKAFKEWALSEGFSAQRIIEPDLFWRKLKTVPGLIFRTHNGVAVLYLHVLVASVGEG